MCLPLVHILPVVLDITRTYYFIVCLQTYTCMYIFLYYLEELRFNSRLDSINLDEFLGLD